MNRAARPVALVTGASRGIGAACARRLARDGMAVALNSSPQPAMVEASRQVASAIRATGGGSRVYPADVSDAAAVDAMVGQCEEELGYVSALVLNAAVSGKAQWNDLTDEDWERVLAVNLKGAFRCVRRCFGTTVPADGGAVVTMSSVLAVIGAADKLHYATTKAGLLGFTRSLARALGPRGVRVNCVMPGAIRTEQELESFPDQKALDRVVVGRQALLRRGVADDIASAVSFLVGPDSTFVTGQTLCVDGGWMMR